MPVLTTLPLIARPGVDITPHAAIATALVEQQLAACVQVVGPIQSTYRWQGAVQTDTEWQCQIKTLSIHYGAVEAAIQALHTYPEIIALPVPLTSAAYGQWWRTALI